MAEEKKEIWIEAGDEPQLKSGEASTLILRGLPKIHFFLGDTAHSALPGSESEFLRTEYDSPVAAPVPKAVASHWKKAGMRPPQNSLVRLSVAAEVVTDPKPKIKVKAGSKTLELDLIKDGGEFSPEDLILFVYGEGSVGESDFPGVKVMDIGKGADAFEPSADVETGKEKRKLGFVDLLIKDPDDGKYRTARYGLFKTRTPEVKLICARIGANNMQVCLDDGNDGTPDRIDITGLADPKGDVTETDLPMAVSPDDPRVKAEWDPNTLRSRELEEPAEEGLTLALFLYGENRLFIKDRHSGLIVFEARFMLYVNDEDAVTGPFDGSEPVMVDGLERQVAVNHLLLDFKEGAKNKDTGAYLHAFALIPQGFFPEGRIAQVSPVFAAGVGQLKAYLAALEKYDGGVLESAGLDFVAPGPQASDQVMETYPEALQADFDPATRTFNNAHQWYFHHYYMHTFPAHRLIDRVRFPTADPPSVSMEGSHYELNKSFLLPTAKDTLFLVKQAKQDNPSRKLAVFGHTDVTGNDAHNNALSRARAQTAHALLVHDPDVWLRRLDGTPVTVETAWGIREIQFMLKTLGHYNGPINGVNDNPTKAASRAFLAAKNLPPSPPGNLDNAARRQLIQDYQANLLDTAMQAGDFFRDAANAPAVFGCGEAFLLLPSAPTDSQNRRVTFVLRINAPAPVDLTQEGAAVPYRAWISPEAEAAARVDDNPPFVVACYDSGFGNTGNGGTDDFSGDLLNAPNRLFVKGRRLVRPTLIINAAAANQRVFKDGDLSRTLVDPATGNPVSMSDAPGPHGTSVMTTMAADGIGDEIGGAARGAQQIVLGTGKDVKFRPIKQFGTDFLTSIRTYQLVRADTEVKVVSSSLLFDDVTGNTPAQRNQLRNAIKGMLDSGKIYFLAAANVNPTVLSRRDVLRTEGGFVAPQRSQKRSSFTGANSFRRNLATVGATNRVQDAAGNNVAGLAEVPSSFSYLGDEVNLAAPGTDIRALASTVPANLLPPNAPPFGGVLQINGGFMRNISGTSFATPMTAGIAAEMLLANPTLQQTANLPKVIEMLEATADPLPSLATAVTAAQQGLFLPGAANADPQLVPSDLLGFRRVHFWKAILAAVNDGLAAESRVPNPAGGGTIVATTHFDLLTGRDHASTIWYGFEIRSNLPDCSIWLKKADGTFTQLTDTGAAMPGDRVTGATWRTTQALRVTSGNQSGFVLPAFPFRAGELAGAPSMFMAQFSIMRVELAKFAEMHVYSRDLDPGSNAQRNVPALSIMDLGQIVRMRDPGAITAAERTGSKALDRIAAHIQEFDDFVFHWTIVPGALDSFAFVHAEGANKGEDMRVRIFALDTLGNVKTDFPSTTAVRISHTGTNGATGQGGAKTGIFINGSPAGASTNINLINGSATFTLADFTVENFKLKATDGTKNDNGAAPLINVGPPGAVSSIRVDVAHFDGVSVIDRPPRVSQRLKYTVTILDDQQRAKTDFTGQVELRVAEGQMGSDLGGPPFKKGVQVLNSSSEAFDPNKFKHTFSAGDRGKFEFSVFNFTSGDVVLQAVSGGTTGTSRRITVLGGALDHFELVHPNSVAAGNGFNLQLRAKDLHDNTITDFEGRVDLSVQPAGMAGAIAAGVKSGVFIGETQAATDDHYTFVHSDNGVHAFRVAAYTAGKFTIEVAQAAIATRSTPDITVTGAAALDHFDFVMGPSQHRGVFFPVIVRALDVGGNVIPNFAGSVQLAGVGGSPPTITGSPHTFVAGDNGQFSFDVRANLNGTLRLRAISGAVQSTSNPITVS